MITEAQREARRSHIGSSDIAAILGVDKYKNAADVYWSKVGELGDVTSKAADRGNRLEGSILDWCADRLGVPLERDVPVVYAGDELFAANLDGRTPDGVPVEAKSSALDEEWGDEGTDQIPDTYIVQVQHQLLCSGEAFAWVPALVAGFKSLDFRLYKVARNDALIEKITTQGRAFWASVESRTPPEDLAPAMDVIKAIRRQPSSTVDLGDDVQALLVELDAASEARKAAEKCEGQLKASILAHLGKAEAGALPDGRLVTFLSQRSPAKVDRPLLKAKWPEAYAECVDESGTHRVMRIKKAARKAA